MNWKLILACAIAGLTALGAALADDTITRQEWVTIILAVLVVLGGGGTVIQRNRARDAEKRNLVLTGEIESLRLREMGN